MVSRCSLKRHSCWTNEENTDFPYICFRLHISTFFIAFWRHCCYRPFKDLLGNFNRKNAISFEGLFKRDWLSTVPAVIWDRETHERRSWTRELDDLCRVLNRNLNGAMLLINLRRWSIIPGMADWFSFQFMLKILLAPVGNFLVETRNISIETEFNRSKFFVEFKVEQYLKRNFTSSCSCRI